MDEAKLAAKILALLNKRDLGKTICPSEVLHPAERKNKRKMDEVRRAALSLIKRRRIVATAKGGVIDIETHRGPIRLRLLRGR